MIEAIIKIGALLTAFYFIMPFLLLAMVLGIFADEMFCFSEACQHEAELAIRHNIPKINFW